jgi:hypothetical protein
LEGSRPRASGRRTSSMPYVWSSSEVPGRLQGG